jgi:hypothetical protein
VDEVTQFECVFAVERISEHYLLPILEALIGAFPFTIRGFHADNGSEYINHRVARLLNPSSQSPEKYSALTTVRRFL